MRFEEKTNYIVSGKILNIFEALIDAGRDTCPSRCMYLIGVLAGLMTEIKIEKVEEWTANILDKN